MTYKNKAIDSIVAERNRQVSKGYDARHDDLHAHGQIVDAACAFLMNERDYWPWENTFEAEQDARKSLVKAAALIVAEIERLDRVKTLQELVDNRDPDAMKWAVAFTTAHPLVDTETALAWFTNAMMAVHDHVTLGRAPLNGDRTQYLSDKDGGDVVDFAPSV